MISLTSLRKTFGAKTAVDIRKLCIYNGEILGLVGNNGAGKTTLFRLMLDLLQPDSGTVNYIDCRTTTDSINAEGDIICAATDETWKQFTGAYLDEGFLIDFLTPEEYFDFLRKLYGIGEDEFKERLYYFKDFMNGEIMEQRKLIRDFSAGNKQKIGVVAAMLHQPNVLILDEPFNFLDPTSQNHLKRLLTTYNKQTGATIILSSHNLRHTIDISSRIALIENGQIIKDLDNTSHGAEKELNEYFQ